MRHRLGWIAIVEERERLVIGRRTRRDSRADSEVCGSAGDPGDLPCMCEIARKARQGTGAECERPRGPPDATVVDIGHKAATPGQLGLKTRGDISFRQQLRLRPP
jgi:hypothetical protein